MMRLSDLRPGVVVPAGAPTDRGMLMAPYTGGDPTAWVMRPGSRTETPRHPRDVSLDLAPPDPAGSRWDGCNVLAVMLARAKGLDVTGGVTWYAARSAGMTAVEIESHEWSFSIWLDEQPEPRDALLAVAVRELCGEGS